MLLVELVSSKRCHTGFDSSSAEGDEYQPNHGQSTATQGYTVSVLFLYWNYKYKSMTWLVHQPNII